MSLFDVTSIDQIDELLVNNNNRCIMFFWAAWHASSKEGGPMQSVFQALSTKHANVCNFVRIEAEVVPEASEKYDVSVVPTFVALYKNTVVGKLEGANPSDLSKLVKKLQEYVPGSEPAVSSPAAPASQPAAEQEVAPRPVEEINKDIENILKRAPVMLFMKGSPEAPRCGFSRQMVEILNKFEVPYETFDILEPQHQDIRSQLKIYSDWPTYPQLYSNSELIGGLDIVKEVVASCNDNVQEFKSALNL